MRRLSGMDAGFLNLESPLQPMHTMALAILRPARSAGGMPVPVAMDDLRRHMASRLDELPQFRARLQWVPLGLNHPVLIEDPEFDLDRHLGQATLPAPGGPDELDRFYASLAGRPLDRRHPLWRLTVVDGLDGGRQGLVLEIHHALMDGDATLATLSCIFSGEDDSGEDGRGAAVAWRPERPPSRSRLVAGALRDLSRALGHLPDLVARTRRGNAAMKAHRARCAVSVPAPGRDTPACSLNRANTADRGYARASLPLEDVKLVKDVAGATVNDVALAIVGGALRAYLEDRNDLPARPLVASVPVGIEAPDAARRTSGNRFSRITTSLATDVADPWERLQAVSAATREAKAHLDLLGRELMADWLEVFPPFVVGPLVRRDRRRRLKHPERLDTNVMISNIRGPAQPWSFGAALVEEMYVTGPPNNGVGVTFVLWDYGGRLLFGILSFADSVEAPRELAEGLHGSLRELTQIARQVRLHPIGLSGESTFRATTR
ncbi:MAG TPA: wax ester/triacylglycerol synthase family O-acyltransferase [Actinomycetota bacterium]|nr:wax ester/triacylglycerol synthase family O-acyltransferase [Actinomycetota bacterium]